jgi:hypothetical protein
MILEPDFHKFSHGLPNLNFQEMKAQNNKFSKLNLCPFLLRGLIKFGPAQQGAKPTNKKH